MRRLFFLAFISFLLLWLLAAVSVHADNTFTDDFCGYAQNYHVVENFEDVRDWYDPLEPLWSPAILYHVNQNVSIGENGTLIVDSTGHYNATANGTSFVPNASYIGDGVITFNGVNESIVSSAFDVPTYPFTIVAWINTSFNSQTPMIAASWAAANGVHYAAFGINASRVYIEQRNNSVTTQVFSTGVIPNDGQWHQIVAVFVNTTYREIYFDGVFNRNSTSSNQYVSTNRSLVVGRRKVADTTNTFNGSIDEVMFYNASLNANQIRLLYYQYTARIPVMSNMSDYVNSSTGWFRGFYQIGNFTFTANGQSYTYKTRGMNIENWDVLRLFFRSDAPGSDAIGLDMIDNQGKRVRYYPNSNTNVLKRNRLSLQNKTHDADDSNPASADPGFNYSNLVSISFVANDLVKFPTNITMDDIRFNNATNDTGSVWHQQMAGEWAIINDTGVCENFGVSFKRSASENTIAYIVYPPNLSNFEFQYTATEFMASNEEPANIDTMWAMFRQIWTGNKDFSPSYVHFFRNNLGNAGESSDNTIALKGRDNDTATIETFLVTKPYPYNKSRTIRIRAINNNIKLYINDTYPNGTPYMNLAFNYFGNDSDYGNPRDINSEGWIAFRVPCIGCIFSLRNFTVTNFSAVNYYLNDSYSYIRNGSGTLIDTDSGIGATAIDNNSRQLNISLNNTTPFNASLDTNGTQPASPIIAFSNGSFTRLSYTYVGGRINFTGNLGRGFSMLYYVPVTTVNVSANQVQILSAVNTTLNNYVLNISAGWVTPSAPRMTYANGSSEYLVYFFDSVAGVVTANVTLLAPGASNVTIDTVAPVLVVNGPANVSSDTDGTLHFTFVPTDANLANCSLLSQAGTIYGTNSNLSNGSVNNITIVGVNASHPLAGSPMVWQVVCTDAVGQSTTSASYQLTTIVAQQTQTGGGGNPGVGSGPGNGTNTTGGGFEMEPVDAEEASTSFFDKAFFQMLFGFGFIALLVFLITKK